ncbi:MAG: hypothetical protein II194_08950 [Bacteroidales bacterium]|nr:hypothetical protein [Bacteroidales bacterium]
MKRIIILIISMILPLTAGAQAQINTKKMKINDFTQKITKVVLNGNAFYDTAIKDEIAARWRISPYEFCTLEEFETIKKDDNYYFLMSTFGQFRKETAPGLQFLTLVKGGKGAEKGIDGMLEVVSLPFASAEYPSGREFVFLPAFLDIIQDHTLQSMERDLNGYGGLGNYSVNITKSGDMDIVFAEEDLSDLITESIRLSIADKGITVTDEDEADSFILDNAPGTLVSYVAVPSEPVVGSYCYKMLIDSETHTLYYFKKHRITKKAGAGFLPEDLERITAHRR